jgi:hypothetical protein
MANVIHIRHTGTLSESARREAEAIAQRYEGGVCGCGRSYSTQTVCACGRSLPQPPRNCQGLEHSYDKPGNCPACQKGERK